MIRSSRRISTIDDVAVDGGLDAVARLHVARPERCVEMPFVEDANRR
jgi:hypothetical protein